MGWERTRASQGPTTKVLITVILIQLTSFSWQWIWSTFSWPSYITLFLCFHIALLYMIFFAFTVLSNFWKWGINYFKNQFSVKCSIGRNYVSGFPNESFELFHLLLLILRMPFSMLTNCILIIFQCTSSVILFQINTSQIFSFPTLQSQSQTSISYIHLAAFLNK